MTTSNAKLSGQVNIRLVGSDGEVKLDRTVKNLITTKGDEYYAKLGAGSNATPLTEVDAMKLGTATTAVHKSTAGGANIASGGYISGSNNAFDSVTAAVVSGDTGWKITYVASWAAGDATNSSIQEVSIVNDVANNADGSAAANTISRALTGTINKAAGDSLTITWVHTFLGA
jgi:hypothetical protein